MSNQICAVCLGRPTDPCQVPCGNAHVFCLRCLQGLITHSTDATGASFPCPCCRNPVPVASLPSLGHFRQVSSGGRPGATGYPGSSEDDLDMEEIRRAIAQMEEREREEEEMLMYHFQINEAEQRLLFAGRRGRNPQPLDASVSSLPFDFLGLQAPLGQTARSAASLFPHYTHFAGRSARYATSSPALYAGAGAASSSEELDMQEVQLVLAQIEEQRQREEEEMLMYCIQISKSSSK